MGSLPEKAATFWERWPRALAFALWGADPSSPTIDRKDLQPEEVRLIETFQKAAPSVVYIQTLGVRRDAFTMNVFEIPQGTGSGFVMETGKELYVVTNYHVIKGADEAKVTLIDQSTWDASLVGYDLDKDIAVLSIDAPPERLRPIPIGHSEDLLVGQKVIAIGNPFGLDHTLTMGVISGLGREIRSQGDRPIMDVIQTDAAINPGNSGGVLLDSAGRLIGVNTAIYSPSGASNGVGFAIPVDAVRMAVEDIGRYGRVIRPTLGIYLAQDQQARMLGLDGLLVLDVPAGSVAEKAGLRGTRRNAVGQVILGDVVVAVDGTSIDSTETLYRILEKHRVGDKVRVTVTRADESIDLDLTLQATT